MVRIELFGKTRTLLHTIEMDTPHVPRVGEVIELHGQFGQPERLDVTLVCDVLYELHEDRIVPVVRCMTHGDDPAAFRRDVLQEAGWLPPGE